MDHRKSKRIPEKTSTSASLTAKAFNCELQQTVGDFQEMETPDHLSCLLRNLYAGPEGIVRTRHRQGTGSKLGKEYIKAVYCHPAYLTDIQSTS